MGEYPARISAASILAEATARCKQKKLSGNRRIPGQDTEGETSASQSDLVALGAGGDDADGCFDLFFDEVYVSLGVGGQGVVVRDAADVALPAGQGGEDGFGPLQQGGDGKSLVTLPSISYPVQTWISSR